MASPLRWQQRLRAEGSDPDPRFTLANERTFLAWIRTALAMLAGGLGIEAFTAEVFARPLRLALAVLLLVMGALLAVVAFFRWLASERAMRRKLPLPLPTGAPILATGLALFALLLVAALVTASPP